MMNSVAAVFPVSDVPQTMEWYRRVLGFAPDGWPAEKPCFAILRRDGIEIMIRQDPSVMLKHGRANRWNAFIRVSPGTLDALCAELREKTKILRGPEKASYNENEFEIEDCNGFVLCFAEPAA